MQHGQSLAQGADEIFHQTLNNLGLFFAAVNTVYFLSVGGSLYKYLYITRDVYPNIFKFEVSNVLANV